MVELEVAIPSLVGGGLGKDETLLAGRRSRCLIYVEAVTAIGLATSNSSVHHISCHPLTWSVHTSNPDNNAAPSM